MRRRPLTPVTVAALGAALVVGVAGPALAWVALSGTADVAVGTARLAAPTDLATSVTATDLDAGRVRLAWQEPTGLAATGWQVERRGVGSAAWAVVSPTSGPTCSAGACTAVDTHGAPGGSFRYRVTALRHTWAGPASEERLSASLTPERADVVGARAQLHGIAVAADGARGFAVGDGGSEVVCADGDCTDDTRPHWVPGRSGTTADLRAATYLSASQAWAVGAGAVRHCTDDCWDESAGWDAVPAAEALLDGATATGVRGSDDDLLVAVVAGAHFLRSKDGGTTWADDATAVAAPDGVALLGVAGPTDHDLLVTGTDGFAARCLTDTATCGDPGTFAPLAVPVALSALTWDRSGQTYLALGADGHLWRGTPDATTITWAQDVAGSGAPAGIRGLAAATVLGASHVWAVAEPAPGVAASGIWHFDGSAWAPQPVTASLDPAALGGNGGGAVEVPPDPAGPLPATCTAPALVVAVAVPAGPTPVTTPTVTTRLRFAGAPAGVDEAQVMASLDGTTWGPAEPLDLGADATSVTFTGPAFDTTTPRTLHVCVMARGSAGLQIDALRIGVQE